MFMHPDTQLTIARDIHRHRLQVAAEGRLAATSGRSRPNTHRRFRWWIRIRNRRP